MPDDETHTSRMRLITDKPSHDLLIKQCTTENIPVLLHVYNSSVPRCRAFLSTLEAWAGKQRDAGNDSIQFARMDYTAETSFMFKFAPNQMPVTVVMVGERWARTVVGTELGEIERLVGEMAEESRRLAGG